MCHVVSKGIQENKNLKNLHDEESRKSNTAKSNEQKLVYD